ncbi:MAG: glycosyltransferase family 4 protein [Chloroflexi bacterium]|nr:glycosyltransferase family 4 protein [Chloroflexota bacterium]
MPSAKTILIICPFSKPNLGGVEAHLEKLTTYLLAHDYRVFLLTYQPLTTRAKGERIEKRGQLEIHRVSWFGNGWFPILEPYFPLVFLYLFPGLFLCSLIFYARHHREIDCIHAHGLVAAAIAKILAKVAPKRTVVSTHAIYHFENRRLLAFLNRWLLGSFDRILAVGEPSRQELIGIGLAPDKIAVHPNWVDLDVFRSIGRETARQRLGLDRPTAFFAGRLLEKKGVLLILAAAKQLPGLRFIFAGDGPLKETVTQAASEFSNVSWAGAISEVARLVEYYNAADVFVSLPLYEEGFAGVYLEALACGTPVIASKRGCLPYFLDPSVATLIEPTVENLVRQLGELQASTSQNQAQRERCRQYAIDHFGEENVQVITTSYEGPETGAGRVAVIMNG